MAKMGRVSSDVSLVFLAEHVFEKITLGSDITCHVANGLLAVFLGHWHDLHHLSSPLHQRLPLYCISHKESCTQ